ncbi:MAG TPA: hypothetical protein VF618_27920 [Thermoanaerobaculia bacterium]
MNATINNGFAFNVRRINRSIKALDVQTLMGNTAVEEPESSRIERLLTVYVSVRPLLGALSSFPLIPSAWRKAVAMLLQTLDGIVTIRGFKAGRDL